MCESVTGGAEKATDTNSSEDQMNSHSVKVSRCLLSDSLTDRCLLGDVPPTLTVLPPSAEQLTQGKATVLCVASKGFPSDWSLTWKLFSNSGSSSIGTLDESKSPAVLEKDGLYSWSSTLSLTAQQWENVATVTCQASQGSQATLTETLTRDQCPQS